MGYDLINKKLEASEAVTHERESSREEHKKPEGYEPHPSDGKLSEVFGLKNSFDDLSVSTDEKGRLTLAVSSQKDFHAPTLNSYKQKLRGSRRRTVYEHFGEFYTEPASKGEGAFAFRTGKDLSEQRILSDFKTVSRKHIAPSRLEAAPFLTLEDDRRRLEELRSKDGRTASDINERLALAQTIERKTELENRFIRRLRIARRRTLFKPALEDHEPEKLIGVLTDSADDENGEDENKPDEKDE
ncbi:MAG: hypothetical protein IKP95_01650 [Ruminococcus sp.]|nr:hypothetical protein [Ruminococcus sp.]